MKLADLDVIVTAPPAPSWGGRYWILVKLTFPGAAAVAARGHGGVNGVRERLAGVVLVGKAVDHGHVALVPGSVEIGADVGAGRHAALRCAARG